MANPFAQAVNTVGTLASGHVVTAAEWNAAVNTLYTYINNTLLGTGINKLATKGDTYAFDGTLGGLQALAVGSNGQVLQADSAQAVGIKWASVANLTALTTKGDICGFSTVNARVPVGTDGQVLQADSAQTLGVKWATPVNVPTGCIVLWSGSIASIPSGWALCDGVHNASGVNLQGLFVVGAGNNSPAATSGMGLVAVGGPNGDVSAGAGLGPSHTHAISGNASAFQGGGTPFTWLASTTSGAQTVTPRYYALAYIEKQ